MQENIILITGVVAAVLWAFLGNTRPRLALLTCPLVIIALLFSSVISHSPAGVIFAFLVVLATISSVLLARPAPGASTWPRALAKYFFYILEAVVLLFIAILFLVLMGPGTLILMLLAGLIIRFSLISRDATVTHVFSTIGASMRQNLPLATSLKVGALGLTGKRRRIMERISDWLTRGHSLSESIKLGYNKCPGYALAMIAAAERIQQVPQAVASIEAQLAQRSLENRKVQPIAPAYPIVVVLVMFFTLAGVMTVVMPKFQTIFKDMGADLPLTTRFLLSAARNYSGLIMLFMAFVILVVVPVSIYLKFRPRRPGQPYLLSRIGDFIKWHFPVLHWFERNYSLLQTVSFLRLSIDAGNTVDKAIAGAAELDTNNKYRQRLVRWLDQVQQGQDVSESARKAGVGSALAWAFDQEINQGNTPAILDSLESFYRTNYGYIVNLARFIFWPCIVILMAIVVGFVVYAVFSAPVAMIHATVDAMIP